MSVIQFIFAVVGILGSLWAVDHYLKEAQPIRLFGIVLLIILLLVVILSFCGVLPLLT